MVWVVKRSEEITFNRTFLMSCCPTTIKPVASGYAGKGDNVYVTGSGPRGIVFIPDIFGNHPNAFQFADHLGEAGFTVVMPDFFGADAWPLAEFPPKDGFRESEQWQRHMQHAMQFSDHLKVVERTINFLKRLGVARIGVLGLCWGGKLALLTSGSALVSACAVAHPSRVVAEDGAAATGPVCCLLSKDEAPMLDVKEALDAKPFASQNIFVRFDDLYHGFLGARGPLEKAFCFDIDDAVAKRVNEAAAIIVKFFSDVL